MIKAVKRKKLKMMRMKQAKKKKHKFNTKAKLWGKQQTMREKKEREMRKTKARRVFIQSK